MLSIEKFGGYKTEERAQKQGEGFVALRSKVKEEEHIKEIYGGFREEVGVKTFFARPNGPRENAETAISCRGPGPVSYTHLTLPTTPYV